MANRPQNIGILCLVSILFLSTLYGCNRPPATGGTSGGTSGTSGMSGTVDGAGVDDPGTPGNVISIADMAKGLDVWKNSGCTRCHTIGDDPGGTSAPSLTGIGDRMTKAELMAWIRNPQAVRPDAHMPAQNISDEDLEYLARYLSLLSSDTAGDGTPPIRPGM
jgi:cytochrome c553